MSKKAKKKGGRAARVPRQKKEQAAAKRRIIREATSQQGSQGPKRVMESVAPLRGVQLRWPGEWPALRQALIGHANGDPAATQALLRIPIGTLDSRVSSALRAFLALSRSDASSVVAELTR